MSNESLWKAVTGETKLFVVKQTSTRTSAFYKPSEKRKPFEICRADNEENCTHELRKLFWALGDHFKINVKPVMNDDLLDSKLEDIRRFAHVRKGKTAINKKLNFYTDADLKELIHMLTGREIDL